MTTGIHNFTRGCTVGLLLVSAPLASAVAISFSDKALFLSAAGNLNKEDFESVTPFGTTFDGGVSNVSFQFFDVRSSHDSLKVLDAPFSPPSGTFRNVTPGGTNYFNSDTDLGGVGSRIIFDSFDMPIRAFGLTFTNLSAGALVRVNGTNYDLPAIGGNSEVFFGLIDTDRFTQVRVRSEASHFAMDDIYLSAKRVRPPKGVPSTPATLPLLGLAVVALGVGRRLKSVR